jgi:hypothetical protein
MTGPVRLLSVFLIAILLAAAFPLISNPSRVAAADSWTTMNSGTNNDLNSIWGSSCNNAYAVGNNGTLLHYNGNTWSSIPTGISNLGLTGVWGSSANNIFVVGWSGTILHFNGTSWSAMTSGTPYDLFGVWGDAPNSVFAVGAMQTILHWNGTAWSAMSTPALESAFCAVWGTAYNNAYAVGLIGDIYHFDGTSWTQMTSDTGNDLFAIWGSSAGDIWAAGTLQSSRVHFNGTTWNGGGMPNLEYYRGLWGTSAGNVYSVGHSMMGGGTMQRYNGSSWSGVSIPDSPALNAIWGSSSSDIFAVGDSGTMLHYGSGCPGGATSAALNTALGTVNLNIDAGYISNPGWLPPADVRCSNPSGYNFPYGMFSFNITNLTPGQVSRVTLRFPNPLPLGARYYKCINGNMVDCSSLATRVNEYTLVLTLADGGLGDADGAANGRIIDPGGPAFPLATTTSHQSSIPTAPQSPVSLSNISVKSASLSATRVSPGTQITVIANVANTGVGNGASVVKLYVNGSEESSQGVAVNSGASTQVKFNISRNEPGAYDVYVGGMQAGNFTVDQFSDPNTILVISGSLVFFAFVIGAVYMTRRKAQS